MFCGRFLATVGFSLSSIASLTAQCIKYEKAVNNLSPQPGDEASLISKPLSSLRCNCFESLACILVIVHDLGTSNGGFSK